MKKITLFLFILCTSWSFSNSLFEEANEAYKEQDFEKAAILYDSLLQEEKSYELYFNLGNTYVKLQRFPEALLMYESAKKINSRDEDLKNNIAFTKSILKLDNTPKTKELGDLIDNVSTWTVYPLWQYLALLFLFITCTLIVIFFKTRRKSNLRALTFYSIILSFTLMSCMYFLSYRQHNTLFNESEGIVMNDYIQVYGEPSENSNETFELTAGYKVQILDEVEDWYEVAINNGNIGWTPKKNIEIISLKN